MRPKKGKHKSTLRLASDVKFLMIKKDVRFLCRWSGAQDRDGFPSLRNVWILNVTGPEPFIKRMWADSSRPSTRGGFGGEDNGD